MSKIITKQIKSTYTGSLHPVSNDHEYYLITLGGGYYDVLCFDDIKDVHPIEGSIYSVQALLKVNSSDFVLFEINVSIFYFVDGLKLPKMSTPWVAHRENIKEFYINPLHVKFLVTKEDVIYSKGYWIGDQFIENGEVIKNFSRGTHFGMIIIDNKYDMSCQNFSKNKEPEVIDISSRNTHAVLNGAIWRGECCDNIKFQGVVEPYFDVRIAEKLGYSEEFIKEWVDEINKLFGEEIVTVSLVDGKFTKVFKKVYRFRIRHSYITLNYLALIMVRYFWYGPFNQIPHKTMKLFKTGTLDFFQSLCKTVCENHNMINDMNFIANHTYYHEIENVNFDLFQKEWREREKGFTNLLKDLKKLQNGN